MAVLYGFLIFLVPFAVVFVIRNHQLAKQNAIGKEQKRAEREAQRWAAKSYRDYCRANNLPVPLSTDEFYSGTKYGQ